MSQLGHREALAPVIRQIVQEEAGQNSVIQPAEAERALLGKYATEGGGPNNEPSGIIAGTGSAAPGFVFTAQADAFIPDQLNGTTSVLPDQPNPQRPRRATAAARYFQGLTGETMEVVVTWAPPVVDTGGRWLETLVSSPLGTEFQDALTYYLIQRTNLGTGEVVTTGMVAHSKQAVTSIREYLEAEKVAGRSGATTDPKTRVANIDSSLFQPVLDINSQPVIVDGVAAKDLVIPNGKEIWYTLTDTTAQFGSSYKYTISAITVDQQEGISVDVLPGNPQAAGGATVDFAPGWCSSFPSIAAGDTTDGKQSYVDITLNVGSLLTDVDIAVIPIMDDALNIDTSAPGASDPLVVETKPNEVILYVPNTGTLRQTIEFIGRNLEACGGISTLAFGSGISMVAGSITKELVGGSDWRYKIKVDVVSGTSIGPRTLTLTCVNGKTTLCSMFSTKTGVASGTQGPTFDFPGETFRFQTGDTLTFSISGKDMASITGFSASPPKTTVTINQVTANYAEITLTAFTGVVTLTATLTGGYTSTGKDFVRAMFSNGRGGDTSDPTGARGSSDTVRRNATVRMS